jgi:limonene-1,2-epoxide hydrolase
MNEPTRQQRQIEVFRTMGRAWHEQQWRTCADLFAPDGVLHSVMLEPITGREAIFERISKLGGAHKKVTLRIQRIGTIDGALFVERVDEIVNDGRRGECPVVGVLEFDDDDRILRWRDYYDRAQLSRAAGYGTEQAHH